jgi:hypothetical protein
MFHLYEWYNTCSFSGALRQKKGTVCRMLFLRPSNLGLFGVTLNRMREKKEKDEKMRKHVDASNHQASNGTNADFL